MKLLLIGPFPGPINGQTIANQTLYEGLSKKHSVDRIDTLRSENFNKGLKKFSAKEDQGKFKIIKFLKIFKGLFQETRQILNNNYDVIYITPGQSYLGFMRFSSYMLSSIIKKKPYYIHIHGGFFRKMYDSQSNFKKSTIDFFLKRVEGAIVLGDSLKPMFKDLIPEEKVFVCENGVQDEFIASEEEIHGKLKRMKEDPQQRVLFLSNLMEEKGILDLLEASKYFSADKIEFNLAGVIEPNIKTKIEEYLEKYPTKLKYHGLVKGMKKKSLLLNNYIFVLPTYYPNEGQPISILEAYTNGCAVVTTDQGGIKDIFQDKVNGSACKKKDSFSIVKALKEKHHETALSNYYYGVKFFKKIDFIERIEKILRK